MLLVRGKTGLGRAEQSSTEQGCKGLGRAEQGRVKLGRGRHDSH